MSLWEFQLYTLKFSFEFLQKWTIHRMLKCPLSYNCVPKNDPMLEPEEKLSVLLLWSDKVQVFAWSVNTLIPWLMPIISLQYKAKSSEHFYSTLKWLCSKYKTVYVGNKIVTLELSACIVLVWYVLLTYWKWNKSVHSFFFLLIAWCFLEMYGYFPEFNRWSINILSNTFHIIIIKC